VARYGATHADTHIAIHAVLLVVVYSTVMIVDALQEFEREYTPING
jgi:hypothetical protein